MSRIRWLKHPEYEEFMKAYIPGHQECEIRAAFYEKFGITLSEAQIGNYKTSRGIKSGTHGGRFQKGLVPANKGKKMSPEVYERCKATMFKKGQLPHNHRPVGSERVNVDGYVEIKVAEPNKWMLKQRYIYEKHYNVKLTTQDNIIFLDGDRMNFEIDNLFRLSKAELARYNQDGNYGSNQDISRAAAQVAVLKNKLFEKKKEGGGNRADR